jgi:hypothetical protein
MGFDEVGSRRPVQVGTEALHLRARLRAGFFVV